jgi:hypothetical protein
MMEVETKRTLPKKWCINQQFLGGGTNDQALRPAPLQPGKSASFFVTY